jgi:hypothetical protein
MHRIKISISILIVAALVALGFVFHEHVNGERWMVKTLADAFEPDSAATPTTIGEQTALPTVKVSGSAARAKEERTLYTLTADLVGLKKDFDGDYHLVLRDPESHATMIAEIPDEDCKAPAKYKRMFRDSRASVDRLVGPPGLMNREVAPKRVQVTGLGFFDEDHIVPQPGMAKNCREIHPVIRIEPR